MSSVFLPKEWIMEKWEEGYYITAMAGEAQQGGAGAGLWQGRVWQGAERGRRCGMCCAERTH